MHQRRDGAEEEDVDPVPRGARRTPARAGPRLFSKSSFELVAIWNKRECGVLEPQAVRKKSCTGHPWPGRFSGLPSAAVLGPMFQALGWKKPFP